MTLDEIAVKYKSPRSSLGHSYMKIYEGYLSGLRDKEISLLEIGIDKGDSIKIWEEYFPKAKITAIDIDQKCVKYATDRTDIIIGNQSDLEFLTQIYEKHQQGFDIIIDDGSHISQDQLVSMSYLFQLLKPGGLYAIEDIQTSYDEKFEGGITNANRTTEIMKWMIDRLNVYGKSPINEFNQSRNIGNLVIPGWTYQDQHTYSIHFYCGLIMLFKYGG